MTLKNTRGFHLPSKISQLFREHTLNRRWLIGKMLGNKGGTQRKLWTQKKTAINICNQGAWRSTWELLFYLGFFKPKLEQRGITELSDSRSVYTLLTWTFMYKKNERSCTNRMNVHLLIDWVREQDTTCLTGSRSFYELVINSC